MSTTDGVAASSLGACSNASSALSEQCGQEPREELERKLRIFASKEFFRAVEEGEIKITAEEGGGYNRIAGFSHDGREFILRIPRYAFDPVSNSVAILNLLQHTSLPTAEVVMFDDTENNLLGCRFEVQKRIRGTSLFDEYEKMSFRNKKRVAKELGKAIRQMKNIKSSVSGRVVLPPNYMHGSGQTMHIREWHSAETKPFSSDYQNERIVMWLIAVFWDKKKKADEIDSIIAANDKSQGKVKHQTKDKTPGWDQGRQWKLIKMAQEMAQDGWLDEDEFCLIHRDFEARNILVNLENGPRSASPKPLVSGIIDWDSAAFFPKFAVCEPIPWIWDFDGEGDYPRLCDIKPPTEEGQKLKDIFDRAAGKEYVKFAYNDGYGLTRELVFFATFDGLKDKQYYERMDSMFQEWKEDRQKLKQQKNRQRKW